MLRDDLLDDRKPDAGAHFAGLLGPLGPVELLEDLAHFLLIHADALIAHRQCAAFAVALRRRRVTSVSAGEYFTALVSRL